MSLKPARALASHLRSSDGLLPRYEVHLWRGCTRGIRAGRQKADCAVPHRVDPRAWSWDIGGSAAIVGPDGYGALRFLNRITAILHSVDQRLRPRSVCQAPAAARV